MNCPGQISSRLKYRRFSKSYIGLLIVWLAGNLLIATEFGSFTPEPMVVEQLELAELNLDVADCNLHMATMRIDLEN